jgi:hypothetical protein
VADCTTKLATERKAISCSLSSACYKSFPPTISAAFAATNNLLDWPTNFNSQCISVYSTRHTADKTAITVTTGYAFRTTQYAALVKTVQSTLRSSISCALVAAALFPYASAVRFTKYFSFKAAEYELSFAAADQFSITVSILQTFFDPNSSAVINTIDSAIQQSDIATILMSIDKSFSTTK